MRNVSVDVVIPAFNAEKYLGAALNSALNQTHQNLKIYLVDDGSVDNTKKITLDLIEQHRGKLQYVYQKNYGVSAARNRGIGLGSGDYIAFLDADDEWLPQKIEKQIDLLEANKHIGFAYCDHYFVDDNKFILTQSVGLAQFPADDILLAVYCGFFLHVQSLVIRRKCFLKTGLFKEDLTVGEDYDFVLRLARHFRGGAVKEKLWYRRVVDNSLSRRDFILDAQTDLRTLEQFLKKSPDFCKKHRDKVAQRLAEYHFSFGYHCLEKGKNLLAFKNLLASFVHKPLRKTFGNIFLCFLPYWLRLRLKKFKST